MWDTVNPLHWESRQTGRRPGQPGALQPIGFLATDGCLSPPLMLDLRKGATHELFTATGVGTVTADVTGRTPKARDRASGPGWLTDLKYRYPGRYMAGWGALVLLLLVVAATVP